MRATSEAAKDASERWLRSTHAARLSTVLDAARKYVAVDGPDRTWEERRGNHEKLGRALSELDALTKRGGGR